MAKTIRKGTSNTPCLILIRNTFFINPAVIEDDQMMRAGESDKGVLLFSRFRGCRLPSIHLPRALVDSLPAAVCEIQGCLFQNSLGNN